MVFLPGGGPFTVYDMSSWSRTIFVPLSILYARKPVVRLPAGRDVAELFPARRRTPRRRRAVRWAAREAAVSQPWKSSSLASIDCSRPTSACRAPRPAATPGHRARGAWMIERLDASDGLSAILPAMATR